MSVSAVADRLVPLREGGGLRLDGLREVPVPVLELGDGGLLLLERPLELVREPLERRDPHAALRAGLLEPGELLHVPMNGLPDDPQLRLEPITSGALSLLGHLDEDWRTLSSFARISSRLFSTSFSVVLAASDSDCREDNMSASFCFSSTSCAFSARSSVALLLPGAASRCKQGSEHARDRDDPASVRPPWLPREIVHRSSPFAPRSGARREGRPPSARPGIGSRRRPQLAGLTVSVLIPSAFFVSMIFTLEPTATDGSTMVLTVFESSE